MQRPAARLEVVAGNAVGTWLTVEDELILGRHAEGPGRLAGDEEISRSHARLTLDREGLCVIEDRGSTNGTFVNGLRIDAPHTLAEGDRIELGATTLVLRELPRMAPATVEQEPEPTVVPAGGSDTQATGESPLAGAQGDTFADQPTSVSRPQVSSPSIALDDLGPPPEPGPGSGGPPTEPLPGPAGPLPEPLPEPPLSEPPLPEPLSEPAGALSEPAGALSEPAGALSEPALDSPPPEPAAPLGSVALSLRLDIDFAAGEARISIDAESDPIRLVFDSGRWRASGPSDTEGDTP